jgi:hypothetical protein
LETNTQLLIIKQKVAELKIAESLLLSLNKKEER